MNNKKIDVTIVTPVFNEIEALPIYEKNIREFMDARPEYNFNVLLIDDASTDGSWAYSEDLSKRDSRFRGLRLARNMGAHIALTAGMDFAQGQVVMTLACDLQDPVETFDNFIKEWRAGADVVWGKRRTREDESWRVLGSNTFYKLLKKFAMPKGSKFTTGSFFLIDRKVVKAFREFQEKSRITFAIVAWAGFEQKQVEYERKARVAGCSGWTLIKMLRSVTDAILAYSTLPLRAIAIIGSSFALLSVLILIYLVIQWFLGVQVQGWLSTVAIISFFSGIQCLLTGIMGEYLKRIYTEVLARPIYCLSKDTEKKDERV